MLLLALQMLLYIAGSVTGQRGVRATGELSRSSAGTGTAVGNSTADALARIVTGSGSGNNTATGETYTSADAALHVGATLRDTGVAQVGSS
jgi:hypothetical protein